MPPIRLGPNDLLEYDEAHGVLICRECCYAIQKSALQSHLLRHKVYREERQNLLARIAQFNIYEPDEVPLPAPGSPPIDALPVISGYRCTTPGCANLCASFKRMKRHHSEVHGTVDSSIATSFSCPVKLQTFFRGTKIKYFEELHEEIEMENPKGAFTQSATFTKVSCQAARSLPSVDVNLETLRYFHHFTTTTSLTLPNTTYHEEIWGYWNTGLILQALQRKWLMCGILAISACHLGILENGTGNDLAHHEQSARCAHEFLAGYAGAIESDLGLEADGSEDEAKQGGMRIHCILGCLQWATGHFVQILNLPPSPEIRNSLLSFMSMLQRLAAWDTMVAGAQEETFTEAARILNTMTLSNRQPLETMTYHQSLASDILKRLSELPTRMTEAFGRPESTRDVLATLSAISALVQCCANSFTSDETATTFNAMVSWLNKVPQHFNDMAACNSAPALVVLAHWAAILMRRAENCGNWFLRGSATKILLHVKQECAEDRRVLQFLVGDLRA
ncbi:hypothetical protein BCR34DRAFT_493358 [Clohesyomyces aquaticus]|uniref:C2H2-type domain-containing protein n=1 Tax=Clohesyomyces aquaticus TaxID=1231657 RepID=A0A1Y1YVS9_9PLEO|nr:hypothetical protein BCR34DRAFT_493358 [Clohesyomyces aquaticus]